jgi:hypothetical protein
MVAQTVSWVRACDGVSQQVLKFGEDLLDRVQVGGVFGQQEQPATCGPDCVADGRAFVTAEVIHDHQITGMERRPKDLFDIGPEPLAVDRAIQQPGRFDPVVSQRRAAMKVIVLQWP